MPGLGEVTAALARRRRSQAAGATAGAASVDAARLTEGQGFDNPGALRMLSYTPDVLAAGAPLVVALHGCTQTAAAYAGGAGWLGLAQAYGFALLCPEQTGANNANRCFNWFQPGDTARGWGEAASIRAMIEQMIVQHGLDRGRVFITGLSAGGAMAATMLAVYPEAFAAGAIVAGLPHGAAASMPEAFSAMSGGRARRPGEWAEAARAALAHRDVWPRVSIWHGGADATVAAVNGEALVEQWTGLHGLPLDAARTTHAAGRVRREWLSPSGEVVVEHHALAGMGHGVPLSTTGEDGYGAAGAFLLETGVGSSLEIAGFWGLTPERDRRLSPATAGARGEEPDRHSLGAGVQATIAKALGGQGVRPGGIDVQGVIAKALTDAGLMK